MLKLWMQVSNPVRNGMKYVKLINHDCLPILMLLYIMLAYLMLFAALSNAVCLHNAFFWLLIFVFMLCLGLLRHSLLTSSMICIMHCAFNLLVFPNSMFNRFLYFYEMAICSPEK